VYLPSPKRMPVEAGWLSFHTRQVASSAAEAGVRPAGASFASVCGRPAAERVQSYAATRRRHLTAARSLAIRQADYARD